MYHKFDHGLVRRPRGAPGPDRRSIHDPCLSAPDECHHVLSSGVRAVQ
jgi:hypothetical protein